jgi:hypothetical protein
MGLQEERRAIGARNEASRRAIGRQMEDRRRGTKAVDDLNSLVEPARKTTTLRTIEPRGSIPVSRGRGVWNESRAPATGGGIASPLTETTTGEDKESTRKYYEESIDIFYSNDYMLAVQIKPLKSLSMKDASGADVLFNFAEPT